MPRPPLSHSTLSATLALACTLTCTLACALACNNTPDHDATASSRLKLAGAGPAVIGASAPAVALDPADGDEIGLVFESYLSPHQEPDEEENTPPPTPATFKSSTPSKTRAQREADHHRGHGVVRFSKDLSRAYVDVKIEGVDVDTINMFHIHCGKPGVLGPILVDFAQATNIQENFKKDGVLSVEITNEHITKTVQHGHGVVGAFTAGCIIGPVPGPEAPRPSKVSTVAGMAQIALERELYFNLHTTGQTFYGDIRGQLHPTEP
ncbi:MAG: CHRD domain-containing protein [Myxococcales bacterium]|nr:CHRD domain-containing protein [Myxococcales bacterium]